jgi:hypothetical protein
MFDGKCGKLSWEVRIMKREFDRDIPMPPLPLNLIGLTPLVPPFTTDPEGSYMGLTEDDHDKPQQDADDL